MSANAPSQDSPSLHDDPQHLLVGYKEGITLFSHSDLIVLMQLPLPGITIFVHGVNSDGEWFEQAEQGLCKGLNARLARCDENLCYKGAEAGQLHPVGYMPELTADGFINPDMQPDTFIQSEDTFSPVIRFRWGYKASGEDLRKFGDAIFLNEQDYWGGGPFANGCSSLPDLWGSGVEEELFLWLHVQHLNPTPDRQVYSCPPRPYYVLAAYRLARLVESIRSKQSDVPITIVCHSQGNMVGIAAAFLGDRMAPASDAAGRSGRCVADSYVLCNAPYSLLESNGTESWTERHMEDPHGRTGRQTLKARTQTLAAFFDIVRKQAPLQQAADRVDQRMANDAHGFTAEKDRQKYGLNGSTHGRVTLYCNPHDQVISATPVQGIGWRGMSASEIAATGGEGVFTQRVFAQGFKVSEGQEKAGQITQIDLDREAVIAQSVLFVHHPRDWSPKPHPKNQDNYQYHYWADHHMKPKAGSEDFWQPHSPLAAYSVAKGLEASKSPFGVIATLLSAPLFIVALEAFKTPINALPPKDWSIPLHAPALPQPFEPEAVRMGHKSAAFDQGFDSPADARDRSRPREDGDPYGFAGGMPLGDEQSEASLRYEHHADLRMKAKRDKLYENDKKVEAEDNPAKADATYTQWRSEKIKTTLANTVKTHATDHSTIMTNPMHAEKTLAYDVAIGCCEIRQKDLHRLRIAADWRFLKGLDKHDSHKVFFEYFDSGYFKGVSPYEWANPKGANAKSREGAMPEKIVNERQWSAPSKGDLG